MSFMFLKMSRKMGKGCTKIITREGYILPNKKFPPVMYGLKGIMELFGVSKATASRYKNTFLKDAVTQKGHVIIVDTAACLSAFGVMNPEKLIKL